MLVLSLAGCDNQKGNEVKKTIEGNMKTYSEMEDGILFSCWRCSFDWNEYRVTNF